MARDKKPSTLSLVMGWAGQKRGLYVGSVILAVASVVTKVLPYLYVAQVVNALVQGERDPAAYAGNLVAIAVLFAVSEACHTASTSLSHIATFEVISNIRTQIAQKLVRMPLGRVLQRGSGSLKNTMVERVDSIETTLAHILPEFTSNLLAPVLIFVLMLGIDVRMAFVALIPVALGLIFAAGLFSGYGDSYQRVLDTTKTLNDTAVEYVRGIEVIKAFGRTEGAYRRFSDAARANAQSYVTWMRRCAVFHGGTGTLLPYTLLSVLPLGAWFVWQGSLTLPDFVVCILLSLGLITPLLTLGSYTDDLATVGTIVDEVEGILQEPEVARPDHTLERPHDHSVELRGVSFSYGEREVLHDVGLRCEPDTVNALVGPSGSGKSTIARLIAGFWDVGAGEIDVGGVDVTRISAEDMRRLVAYVSQDNYLFDETVRENIRMGRPSATDAEVEQIARQSGCYDFIMGLDDGFDTVAGSSGGHLSGGERQRVCIARAMLKDAPIVVLDEATAYTDPESEAQVDEAIARLVRGKTLIMIAHRLYTVQTADRIFLVDDGRVDAAGTHEELLAASPLYRRMWESHLASRDSEEETA